MTRLLEAGPLPALLFEPTFGRVGLDRVQYARPNGSVRLEGTYPPLTGRRESYEAEYELRAIAEPLRRSGWCG